MMRRLNEILRGYYCVTLGEVCCIFWFHLEIYGVKSLLAFGMRNEGMIVDRGLLMEWCISHCLIAF